jgi:hypothetical protein
MNISSNYHLPAMDIHNNDDIFKACKFILCHIGSLLAHCNIDVSDLPIAPYVLVPGTPPEIQFSNFYNIDTYYGEVQSGKSNTKNIPSLIIFLASNLS